MNFFNFHASILTESGKNKKPTVGKPALPKFGAFALNTYCLTVSERVDMRIEHAFNTPYPYFNTVSPEALPGLRLVA
jgi:hypothetical protein